MISITNNNKKRTRYSIAAILVLALAAGISSCKKYLDVVPDNVAVLENAFKLRVEAEKYLFTCYSYMPKNGDGWYNAALTSADEIWYPQTDQNHWHAAFRIAQGQQNVDAPLFDEWTGLRKGGTGNTRFDHQKMWVGIRNCNIFLENITDLNKVPDITPDERSTWIGEGMFLKAYYLFYMLRMYGPIPLVKENIPIDAPIESTFSKRMPVDSCVNYISSLLDSAAARLPERIQDENTQLGRATKPIALSVKARLWVMAASPLFNGNPDYANFTDKEGVHLFNPSVDAGKWVKARDAVKAAIESAEKNGFALYKYTNDVFNLNAATKIQLNIRNAMTQKWNVEHVWGNSQMYFANQALCMPPMERGSNTDRGTLQGVWAPPIKIAKMFYTKNGVPIDEDKTLNFNNYEQLRTATTDERYYIEPNFVTARLNFDREPRFYADLGFDGGVWYQKDGNSTGSDINTFYVKAKNTERAGFGHYINWSETGYFVKKLVSWESTTNSTSSPTWRSYPWPEMRMADLYLLYAEAVNEVDPASSVAIEYLDKVRERAGLSGVVTSWSQYSTNPTKYASQDGLRKIIHHERGIELVFEGQRFWDLRRWKEADEELNKDITGWNITGKTADSYYKERLIFSQNFVAPRDYFWPIGNYDTRRNLNLVENPGW
ncbi:RagB/SusD family nutrient uptake outer membrane protein [Chitinophaga tropicalis]|uniref:RagB/SusD family nutrient uptake outer membrane protein n=1 Tax=Chitinophaga tropicalis TaxID=2683588 RepID=A0A7K1U4S8_9BACT|nr:RagB/SusD family nutrient uptake outer membrane protein [Chitinophaga tropicalis]MVT09364.1 RagB/SusD family nutrient uptake outer membrane protein [Chitinophaga tropicalis]